MAHLISFSPAFFLYTPPHSLNIRAMKFLIVQTLALLSTVSVATYLNTSYVPYGSGYFYDHQIHFCITIPHSVFSAFSVTKNSYDGYSVNADDISVTYEPSGNPINVIVESIDDALSVHLLH